MDFVTESFKNRIANEKQGDRKILLQARIEYVYYFLLGYFWNSSKDSLNLYELSNFANRLDGSLTMGAIVYSLKKMNKNLINPVAESKLEAYPIYRNENIGHGYLHKDRAIESEKNLEGFYNDLVSAIPMLNCETDIIVITGHTNDYYEGRVYHPGKSSYEVCQISEENLKPVGDNYPQLFFRKEKEYHKVSPFVMLDGDEHNPDVLVFNKIEDKFTGLTRYTQLFKSGKKDLVIPEFKDISIKTEFNRKSYNGTYVNIFELNHDKKMYIDVGILDKVRDFTVENYSHVAVVLWGNGGVGKTACVQELCERMLNDKPYFKHVVFVSAKNRKFNEVTGKVEALNNTCTYYDVIAAIYGTIYEKKLVCAEDSKEFQDAVEEIVSREAKNGRDLLLIVDDFETFADEEKRKISGLIDRMDIRYHKVIITTRNKKLAEGKSIPANKLDINRTVEFVQKRMELDSCCDKRISEKFREWIEKDGAKQTLFDVTDGVPLFILQWINLFKAGYGDGVLSQNLTSDDSAVDFLSGKVYEYFSDKARIIYSAISKVVDEQTLQFQRSMLRGVCAGLIKSDSDFDEALEELEEMLIIKAATENETIFSVTSEAFCTDMGQKFNSADKRTRKSVEKQFANSGSNKNLSLFESLLKEADDSQTLGNTENTVKKYRKAIALPDASKQQKKRAVTKLMNFLRVSMQPDVAVDEFYGFGEEVSGDPDMQYQLIFALWSCDQRIAINQIEKILDQYDEINEENLTVYALAASYFIQHYKNNGGKRSLVFDAGKKLFDFVSGKSKEELSLIEGAGNHNISTALLHFMEIIVNSEGYSDDIAVKVGKFICDFSNNYLSKNKANALMPKTENDKNGTESSGLSPQGIALFTPEYVMNNHMSGQPQYLNGTVNGIKGGIPWHDFEKFSRKELDEYGGTHAIMRMLGESKKTIPVAITSVNEKGLYALSCYSTNLSLHEILGWNEK